ncbi:R8 protein [Purpureocillium takamizusanense]|uniref:R8 protein n=1 Tax=Purpureocillium takamizusanense TaxID=2060973 RepID=A0A9Q8Q695_9HYPO|nr:R8 protein [Purpureocillium takamizusanense]UNI13815.1 R8 protein [Purpureocillium takamizusanense]
MFYSHEILCNSQYGVATIWLAATVAKGNAAGKGGLRPLTRKAVQGVNVPKACATIIDPGAPLALRLQSSLLFGVSRVFAQQCTYVLADAEKIQSDMMTFFRVLQTSELDPHAGKTKRHNIVLEDDPSFDLFNALPNLDFLRGSVDNLIGVPSQGSTNKYSQMTPRRQSQSSLSSLSNPALLPFDLPSSLCAGSFHLPSEFGHRDSPLAGKSRDQDNMPEFMPFVDDELDPIPNVSLDFDGDGNLLGIFDQEPELPPLPDFPGDEWQLDQGRAGVTGEAEVQPFLPLGAEQEFGMGEAVLPNDEVFVPRQATKEPRTESYTKTSQTTDTEQVSAHNQRIRRRRPASMVDGTAHLPRQDLRNWDANYAENMERETSRKRQKKITPTQARKNALALIYGNRIANVGLVKGVLGITHPLAEDFAGRTLEARLHGLNPEDLEPDAVQKRGRRRKSPEAFAEETAEEEGLRSVRPRIQGDAELGRANMHDDGDAVVFGDDDTAPEMGLDPAVPMEERHSSSIMPWIRSASAARVHGSTQKPAPDPSPLHGRGSVLNSIERHSDPANHPLGPAAFESADSSIDFGGDIGALDFNRGNDTQASHTGGLDMASQEFLSYATAHAVEKGVVRGTDDDGDERRWISFQDLASPDSHSKGIAAQAFLHVLSLATKGVVAVQQDGTEAKQPFGTIHIGVTVQPAREESCDELA